MRSWNIIVGMIALSIMFMCQQPFAAEPALPGKVLEETISQGGMERTYTAYIPSGELSSPALIIALHGAKGTGKTMREASAYQFDHLAEKVKCVVVYPDGYMNHWNDCRNTPTEETYVKNIDDVSFITSIIEACCRKWSADPKRVYAVGLSNGGHLCFRLATEVPRKLAGIAVIGANMPAPGFSKCTDPRPVMPLMIVNGTDDPINPFEGGTVRLLYVFSRGPVVSSKQTARLWLKPEDSSTHPIVKKYLDRDPGDETYIESLSWPDSKVRLYIVYGGGHTIPGGAQYLPQFIVGRVNKDINCAEEAWKFFQSNRK